MGSGIPDRLFPVRVFFMKSSLAIRIVETLPQSVVVELEALRRFSRGNVAI
jgi:hypothetical protein